MKIGQIQHHSQINQSRQTEQVNHPIFMIDLFDQTNQSEQEYDSLSSVERGIERERVIEKKREEYRKRERNIERQREIEKEREEQRKREE